MRYLTVRIRPEDAGFHPVGAALAAEPAVTREAIHHVELLDDDTLVLFAEGSGDADRYEAIMADSPLVEEYLVSGDDRWMAVSRFEPSAVTRQVVALERNADVVIETPITINADGSLRATFLGTDAAFRTVLRRGEADGAFSFDVLETGRYDPDAGSLMRALTTRQQQVLEAAVDVGYYDTPRRATQVDVADRLGIAPTTAGEHLRKVEARVFERLVE